MLLKRKHNQEKVIQRERRNSMKKNKRKKIQMSRKKENHLTERNEAKEKSRRKERLAKKKKERTPIVDSYHVMIATLLSSFYLFQEKENRKYTFSQKLQDQT
jgi:hypothetical protein